MGQNCFVDGFVAADLSVMEFKNTTAISSSFTHRVLDV
jgi:hypothetical protein